MFDILWTNIHIATMAVTDDNNGFGIIKNAAMGIKDKKIAWIGPQSELAKDPDSLTDYLYDGKGHWMTPGLIDCHTHLIYAGNRANEFEMRLKGISYEEISKAGGGIFSSVKNTRLATEEELYESALSRIKTLFHEGVLSFEIKSGYGLDLETERKMLRVATRLRDDLGFRIQRTFLGAHAIPPEYKDRADNYIHYICEEMIPKLHAEDLIDCVDGFCENIGFTHAQIKKLFEKAKELGLPVKLHAEQLSNQHGATLTAAYKGLSADHLEYLDEDGVKALAEAGTVATILPGAFYFLRETKTPPIDLLRKYNVPIAIATDHNPGTSPTLSILLMMNMACTLFKLTPEEALLGVTKNAAQALGYQDVCGTLEVGKCADMALWEIDHPRDLAYFFGRNPCKTVMFNGNICYLEADQRA